MLRLIGGVVVYGMALYGAIQLLERYNDGARGLRPSGTGESGAGNEPAEKVATAAGETDATHEG